MVQISWPKILSVFRMFISQPLDGFQSLAWHWKHVVTRFSTRHWSANSSLCSLNDSNRNFHRAGVQRINEEKFPLRVTKRLNLRTLSGLFRVKLPSSSPPPSPAPCQNLVIIQASCALVAQKNERVQANYMQCTNKRLWLKHYWPFSSSAYPFGAANNYITMSCTVYIIIRVAG